MFFGVRIWGARACRNQSKMINLQWHPLFVSEAIKKGLCREIGGIELTMMEAINSNNNDSNREIIVILVHMGCISHWIKG